MSKRFHLPRIIGLIAAIICTCVTLALATQVAPPQKSAPDSSGDIVLDVIAPDDEEQLPPVVFDHNRHTGQDKNGETCAKCHDPEDKSHAFLSVTKKKSSELEDAYHAGCVSCHAEMKNNDIKAGPLQAECRACHNADALPQALDSDARVEGGLDASLHARHVSIANNHCESCHHPVKNPVSPKLEADSCRSCHPSSYLPLADSDDKATKKPPFRDVAHKKCVSCHQVFAAKGAEAVITCTGCHDAGTKAGYERLSPRPRLEAGQPDTILMGSYIIPLDEQSTEDTDGKPSMPAVVFNHKLHEAAADNCTSCHHNTLQKCSTCHTPQGSPEGNNVSTTTAMHAADSSYSCIGCHETRKTAVPECASCHGAIPAKTSEGNCATCHDAEKLLRAKPVSQIPPHLSSVEDTPKKPDLSAGPETVSIGILSDEYEPAVFPHKKILDDLASGIQKTTPGMMSFHTEPYTICASCHHNSPPSATPPSCSSCHDKSRPASVKTPSDNRPLLKIAYHQQCMSCHTRMNITKPANTDCEGCHTSRTQSGNTEGGK